MTKILLIQTAFIGDVILATANVEALHTAFPTAKIDFLLRKGNENLLEGHPFLNKVLVWDKKQKKRQNMWAMIRQIRAERYDLVINLQRFFSTGLITTLSKGKTKVGFDKNPWSLFFDIKKTHEIGNDTHEVTRNLSLLTDWRTEEMCLPKLYPSADSFAKAKKIVAQYAQKYICIAPTSVWFTKQLPAQKWIELIQNLPQTHTIFLLGAPSDKAACQVILEQSQCANVVNLAGKLNLLDSAALMRDAHMNYVNDSAPLHLCSAMNAPVTAVFCSTVPRFGFTPLSDNSRVVEVKKTLDCRPCGLHGFKACPKGHFNCAKIAVADLV